MGTSRLDNTLAHLAPGVSGCRDLEGRYNPRRGLAIYCLPIPGYSPSSPGVVLGEALAARSGLGCTLLEGIPKKIPEGAVVVAQYNALKAIRPDLLDDVPELREQGQYAIKLGRSALVTSPSREGLSSGMQTLAMLILRHNEEQLPACVVTDMPFCDVRGLAVELDSREISAALLMQIVSFVATFKANRLQFILNRDFDATREIPGIDNVVQTCQSFGIAVGVRLKLLEPILKGEMTLIEAWSAVRAAARAFGASHAALDDACPPDADPQACRKVVASVAAGEVGLQNFSLDARLVVRSGFPVSELKANGVTGWFRLWDRTDPPPVEMDDIPLVLDVQAPLPGFSSRTVSGMFRRIDAAMRRLRRHNRREFIISFRDVGVSHMWQNLLYPAATGLIAAWGSPAEAGARFSNLLYGEAGEQVMDMWDAVSKAYPPGLTVDGETLVRRTAFGYWPETERDMRLLSGIDWLGVTGNIKNAAEALKQAAVGLSRNAATLSGARLSLYALSWLHCFAALVPELEKRQGPDGDDDGRVSPIAHELLSNFRAWHTHLQELSGESGLEFSEMPRLEAMGVRLQALCDGAQGHSDSN